MFRVNAKRYGFETAEKSAANIVDVRLAFERLRVRAGMPDLHFHDLRHEAISRLFERGLNIAEVSAISGHKELRMLQRYTHLRAVDLVARIVATQTHQR